MKKLNRKGFTLIELLAVIVILAVVLVVTIPSVITAMNDARDKNLQNAANTVEEWFTKQYELSVLGTSLGSESVDTIFNTNYLAAGKSIPTSTSTDAEKTIDDAVLKAAGISGGTTNVTGKVYLKADNKTFCVELVAVSGGNFYVTASGYTNTASSSGC